MQGRVCGSKAALRAELLHGKKIVSVRTRARVFIVTVHNGDEELFQCNGITFSGLHNLWSYISAYDHSKNIDETADISVASNPGKLEHYLQLSMAHQKSRLKR